MTKALPVAIWTLGVLAIASAAIQDSVTMRRVPTKGQVLTYEINGTAMIGGTSREILGKRLDTVIDVLPDGSYKSKWEEQDVTVDGQSVPDQPEGTTVSKPTGEVISTETPESGRAAVLGRVYYPAGPVKIGDTWSFEGKKDDKLGVFDFKADLKLLGEEKIGAVDTWKIQDDVKETTNTPPAILHQTVWVDKKDGSVVKLQSKFTDFPFTSAVPDPVTGNMNYLRKDVK